LISKRATIEVFSLVARLDERVVQRVEPGAQGFGGMQGPLDRLEGHGLVSLVWSDTQLLVEAQCYQY
jgi:hypothetical protein